MSKFVRLTWGEFKEMVEDIGVGDDTAIEYIDIGGHDLDRREGRLPNLTSISVGFGEGPCAGRLEVC